MSNQIAITSRRRRRLLAICALVIALAGLGYVSLGGIESNLVYYLTPDELLQKGPDAQTAMVRLGGLVQHRSMQFDAKTLDLRFALGNLANGDPKVEVASHGVPPQMFQEGIGAIVEGHFDGKIFQAERVMVKHSNEYRPPQEGQKPQQRYKALETHAKSDVP